MYKNLTKTLFAGHNLVYLPSCHSTNEYANVLMTQKSVPEGTIIITDHQTRGKGQRGNVWESQPGKNLTFSIILNPSFIHPKNHFWLNPTISLAVADFLAGILDRKIHIKWPNDIYVQDQKIAGILIENSIADQVIERAIVGIGLNVNQDQFTGFEATSMALLANRRFSLDELMADLIPRIESRYLALRSSGWPEIKKDYLNQLYRINQKHLFRSGQVFEGTITGIDEAGRLLVRRIDGRVNSYDVKDIEYL